MTEEEKAQLEELGYVIFPNFIDQQLLAALRLRLEEIFLEEGDRAGWEFKREPGARRLANLMNKGAIFEKVVAEPRILEAVKLVLGPEFKLSSLNARSANPRSDSRQPLHADMAAIPDEKGYWVCNALWMLDDFTAENGAVRLIPGSHRWGKLPQDVLSDLYAPHPDEVLLTGPAGTVAVINAHMWHGATENRTGSERRAIHAFYCRRDKPQQQYQKALIDIEVQRRFSQQIRQLLALDDPLNDVLSSQEIIRSGFLK